MPKVFTIYETEPYQEELVKHFVEIGLNVFQINSHQLRVDATEALEADIFLIDMTRFTGEAEYLPEIQNMFPEIPIILTHLKDQISLDRIAEYENVIDFISLPISIPDLASRILNAWNGFVSELSTGAQEISGSLQDQNLINIIQTFSSLKQSGIVSLDTGTAHGTITFKKGQLVNARYKNLVPNKSLQKMLLWLEGNFKIEFTDIDSDDHIRESVDKIVSDGLERISSYIEKKEKLPESEIYSATQFNAEGFSALEMDILQFFVPGKTLISFLSREKADDLEIIAKVVKMFDAQLLFSSKTLRDEADEKNTGIGKIFSKIGVFNNNDQKSTSEDAQVGKDTDKTGIKQVKYVRRYAIAQLNEIKDILKAL